MAAGQRADGKELQSVNVTHRTEHHDAVPAIDVRLGGQLVAQHNATDQIHRKERTSSARYYGFASRGATSKRSMAPPNLASPGEAATYSVARSGTSTAVLAPTALLTGARVR